MLRARLTFLGLLVPFLVFLTGCQGAPGVPQPAWEPGSLYLRGEGPIHVELDVNPGCEPDERSLSVLQSFLERHTGRPVLFSEVEVLGDGYYPMAQQAAKHWGGAPTREGDYIYVLFYDSSEQAGVIPGMRVFAHVSDDYPGAIYVNKSGLDDATWIPWDDWRDALPNTLAHEAGHVLGLVLDEEGHKTHGQSAHCTSEGCLMSLGQTESWWRALVRIDQEVDTLCSKCLADLARRRQLPTSARFRAGFLTRSEEGYWVAGAPGAVVLGLTPYSEVDWASLREKVQQSPKGSWRRYGMGEFRTAIELDFSDPTQWEAHRSAVSRAMRDHNPIIQELARSLLGELEDLCAKRSRLVWR